MKIIYTNNLSIKISSLLLYFIGLFFICGCQEKQMPNDPTVAFAVVKAYYDDKDYEEALKKLEEFKARFPYSSYSIQADLLIAESEYALTHYDEAAISYSNFAKFHPNHEKVPYVLYMVGNCYWKISPQVKDRDQTYTQKAVSAWQELREKYPDSSYAKQVISSLDEANLKLAQNLDFITAFYYRKKNYSACAYRSLELIEKARNFPEILKDAIPRAIYSFEKVLKEKKSNPEGDSNIYLTMSEDKIEYIIEKLKNYHATFNKQ